MFSYSVGVVNGGSPIYRMSNLRNDPVAYHWYCYNYYYDTMLRQSLAWYVVGAWFDA